ncbi:MAG: transketolase [Firmicutes bacterium]|nr:transketolase [Bacillota bacterium]
MTKIEEKTINTIRMFSAEAVQAASSGHPGMALGAAPIAYKLYADIMNYNGKDPSWFNRDRFVLSAGHGSALLYSALALFGFGITGADLANFRQAGSLTPGHPEYGHTPGVDTTTGPLGQGFANAVGMAAAEKMLAAKFNRPGYCVVDHYTYVLCGDGCMMEGVESEAASLAGTWGLDKLIVFYDKNNITIEGDTDIAFTEDVGKRHEAQSWFVQKIDNCHDLDAIAAAVNNAKRSGKPSLIIVKTVIGYGSAMAGTADAHGTPLGAENIQKMRAELGWTDAPFVAPADVAAHTAAIAKRSEAKQAAWNTLMTDWASANPDLHSEFKAWTEGDLSGIADDPSLWAFPDKPDATRNTGGAVLNRLAALVPNLVGGSADLAPSNKSYMKGMGDFGAENPVGRNLHFGIREHAMAAVCNGMYLHGGLRPYCATFFVFLDYMKNPMRMSALMNIPVIYMLTHDSIGVGEDGPTHQPIEQLVSLRSVPNLKVWRPADGRETVAAWLDALAGTSPAALVLSRQNLPQYPASGKAAFKGGYILEDAQKAVPDVLLIASGSEVELAVKTRKALLSKGVDARVISVPCMELFDAQSPAYRESVMPNAVRARVCIEAGSSYGMHKYAGLDGACVCMDTFGASAPPEKLFERFGFTVENVVKQALRVFVGGR